MYIASQVLVGIADILYVCSMLSKTKMSFAAFMVVSDLFFASHFLFLDGGITGSLLIYVDILYLLILFILQKYKKTKYNTLVTIITMVVDVAISVVIMILNKSVISLLPLFSILIYLTGMIFKNVVFVKGGAMVKNALNIVYMILITSYVGAALEFCLMISAMIGMILSYRRWKKTKNTPELSKVN